LLTASLAGAILFTWDPRWFCCAEIFDFGFLNFDLELEIAPTRQTSSIPKSKIKNHQS
jgi:hypothetical protein